MTTNRKYRNSKELKASWKMQEFLNWGYARTSDEETENEIFCRMLDAVGIKYDVVKEDEIEYFVLK